jgi:hypothetical protein
MHVGADTNLNDLTLSITVEIKNDNTNESADEVANSLRENEVSKVCACLGNVIWRAVFYSFVCTSGTTTLPRGSSVRQKITGHLPPAHTTTKQNKSFLIRLIFLLH